MHFVASKRFSIQRRIWISFWKSIWILNAWKEIILLPCSSILCPVAFRFFYFALSFPLSLSFSPLSSPLLSAVHRSGSWTGRSKNSIDFWAWAEQTPSRYPNKILNLFSRNLFSLEIHRIATKFSFEGLEILAKDNFIETFFFFFFHIYSFKYSKNSTMKSTDERSGINILFVNRDVQSGVKRIEGEIGRRKLEKRMRDRF